MSVDVAIFTSEPDAKWVSDARTALASVEDSRVVVMEASHRSSTAAYRAVIVDAGGVDNALLLIRHCHGDHPHTKIFMVSTGSLEWKDTYDAIRAGATDVLLKDQIDVIALHLASPPTILLADNNDVFRKTRGDFLQEEGYEVVMASSPAEAIELVAQGGIDLAILDVRLEEDDNELDFSGLDVARALPSLMPFIVATNHPTTEIVKKSLRPYLNGHRWAAEFIDKHDPEDTFLEVVKRILPLPFSTTEPSGDDEIAQLYEKLADLQLRRDPAHLGEKQQSTDPSLEQELKTTFQRLRALQKQEAEEFRAAAENRLLMPIDEGQRLLAQARQLLNENESPTS